MVTNTRMTHFPLYYIKLMQTKASLVLSAYQEQWSCSCRGSSRCWATSPASRWWSWRIRRTCPSRPWTRPAGLPGSSGQARPIRPSKPRSVEPPSCRAFDVNPELKRADLTRLRQDLGRVKVSVEQGLPDRLKPFLPNFGEKRSTFFSLERNELNHFNISM